MDLIVTMDDATSEILSIFLVEEEGTASTLRALGEVIERQGLFVALYTDRGSHYFHTPAAGGPVSKTQLTQVGRALKQLGIEHIAAYSPEARGRSERLFRTLQDRLPKELRLAGITTVDAANAWLKTHYMAEHNAHFAIAPQQEGSAFVPDEKGVAPDILCVIEERNVANDNTVAWQGLKLQLPESRLRPHFVRAKVMVREYPDGTLSVDLGPHRLARYTGKGELITKSDVGAANANPAAASGPACSRPSRDGLQAAEREERPERRPPLTASARAGKRLPSRKGSKRTGASAPCLSSTREARTVPHKSKPKRAKRAA
jgi:hypothetical protein